MQTTKNLHKIMKKPVRRFVALANIRTFWCMMLSSRIYLVGSVYVYFASLIFSIVVLDIVAIVDHSSKFSIKRDLIFTFVKIQLKVMLSVPPCVEYVSLWIMSLLTTSIGHLTKTMDALRQNKSVAFVLINLNLLFFEGDFYAVSFQFVLTRLWLSNHSKPSPSLYVFWKIM